LNKFFPSISKLAFGSFPKLAFGSFPKLAFDSFPKLALGSFPKLALGSFSKLALGSFSKTNSRVFHTIIQKQSRALEKLRGRFSFRFRSLFGDEL
jgi:hypothetical protein